MCGIIGYTGNKNVTSVILKGLKNLEYRGYDSAGIAVLDNKKIFISKFKGRISDLENSLKKIKIKSQIGLGHTRWATHGEPSKKNAHPHTDCFGKIALVHNGIIENHDKLRKELKEKGCKFKSETDTEVIAHLISKFYKKSLRKALIKTLKKLKGSYALAIINTDNPEKLLTARCDSPLIIGKGKNENFIASDAPAILEHTKKVIYLKDYQVAEISKNKVEVFNFKNKKIPYKVNTLAYDKESAEKKGYKHYMLKEIYEQPKILSTLFAQYLTPSGRTKFTNLNLKRDFLKNIKKITIVACGTAYHAGLVGKYIIESLTDIPVEVDLSSEFRYRNPIIKKKSLFIAISQSGETADTLAAIRKIKQHNVKILSICNVLGSSLTRESNSIIYTHAGPEIGVASTKAYTAQLMVLYLLTLHLATLKNILDKTKLKKIISSLKKIPHLQKQILRNDKKIKNIAKRHLHFGAFLYLGRNINFPTALEGALKLKEISYIPAEGYAAGEMKHGPIALIDEYRAVVCIANNSLIYEKMVSNIREILARRGKIVVIATKGNKNIKKYVKEIIYIPKIENLFSPLLVTVTLQLFAYYIAQIKGYDVDKPRNLAKSVTVE